MICKSHSRKQVHQIMQMQTGVTDGPYQASCSWLNALCHCPAVLQDLVWSRHQLEELAERRFRAAQVSSDCTPLQSLCGHRATWLLWHCASTRTALCM
jgi:hypothetical protein